MTHFEQLGPGQMSPRLRLVTAVDDQSARPAPSTGPARRLAARARLVRLDVDGVFSLLMFLLLLFSLQLGTLGAALLSLVILAYGAALWRRLWAVLVPRTFLLVVPGFALLSVFWSQAPGDSAKFALEFALTVLAGLLLSAARNPHAVFRGMAGAFLIYVCAAIAFGHQTAVGAQGGQAFSGLSDGKNLLADIAATGLLISLGVAAHAVQRGQVGWALAGFGAALVQFYAVASAHSAGALLGLGFGLMALAGLLAVYRTGVGLRAILVGFLCVCLVVGAASYEWLSTQLIELGADLFDKDPTLTGRTYLWYRADQLIAERPLLGRGFYAFWLQGDTDAEGLWRYAGITSRGGFSFHNTGVEILVQLGWFGLVTVLLTVLIGLGLLLRRFIRRPNLALCIWMSILLYELVRTPIEAVGMAPFYFSTILTFAALASALGSGKAETASEPAPDERRRAPAPDRSRRLLEPAIAPSRRLRAPTVEQA